MARGWIIMTALLTALAAAQNAPPQGVEVRAYAGPRFERARSVAVTDGFVLPTTETEAGSVSTCWSALLAAPSSGRYRFVLESVGGACLWLDDTLVIRGWGSGYFRQEVALDATAGQQVAIQLLHSGPATLNSLTLSWAPPGVADMVPIPARVLTPVAPVPRLVFFRPEPDVELGPPPNILVDVVAFQPAGGVPDSLELTVNLGNAWIYGARREGPARWLLRNLPVGDYRLKATLADANAPRAATETSFSIRENTPVDTPFRKSGVCVPWRWASLDEIRDYGATVVGWGPALDGIGHTMSKYRAAGIRSVAFDANLIIIAPSDSPHGQRYLNDPSLRASLMQSYSGEPVTMPWWKDCLWRCPLHSFSRAQLLNAIEEGMAHNPDTLHFDGALGTLCAIWEPETGLGCLCQDNVTGFRDYLGRRFSSEELAERGVADIHTFDYASYLRRRFPDAGAFHAAFKAGEIPWMREYQSFQFRALAGLYRELVAHARGMRGRQIPLGANLHSLRFNMLPPVDAADFLYCEMRYQEAQGRPVLPFKLAETFGKPFAAMMDGRAIRSVRDDRSFDLIKRWVGLTVGMGSSMCIPSLRGLKLNEDELEDLRFNRADYIRYHRFVAENAHLLDPYGPVSQVGLLYSNLATWEQPYPELQRLAADLLGLNIPFRLVVAGDDRLSWQLASDHLAGLDALVIPGDPHLDSAQQQILDDAKVPAIFVPWDADPATLRDALGKVIPLIRAPDSIWVLPRRHSTSSQAPLVVHVVNRQFDVETNTHAPVNNGRLVLTNRLLNGLTVRTARLHTPEMGTQQCHVERQPDGFAVTLPDLPVWGVVEVGIE